MFLLSGEQEQKAAKKKVDAVFLQVVKAHHSLLAVAVVMGCCFNFRIYKQTNTASMLYIHNIFSSWPTCLFSHDVNFV